jgi:hypothetical protein
VLIDEFYFLSAFHHRPISYHKNQIQNLACELKDIFKKSYFHATDVICHLEAAILWYGKY